MSEAQKDMAKRIVEILVKNKFLKEGLVDGHTIAVFTLKAEHRKDEWINQITKAITQIENESIIPLNKRVR